MTWLLWPLRRYIARLVIRRAWRLGRDWSALERYSISDSSIVFPRSMSAERRQRVLRLSILLNILGLVSTALGGDSSWTPDDVVEDFKRAATDTTDNDTEVTT